MPSAAKAGYLAAPGFETQGPSTRAEALGRDDNGLEDEQTRPAKRRHIPS